MSPRLAEEFRAHGLDCIHVRDLGLQMESDKTILEAAARDGRFVVSRDADFSVLLAQLGLSGPSFVHLRTPGLNRPRDQADLIFQMLSTASTDVLAGSIVTLHLDRYRVRRLPIR